MKRILLISAVLAAALFSAGCATGGAKKITYIEVSARGCYVCQRMDEVIDEVEKQYGNVVDIRTYSGTSESADDMVKKYKIKKFPANIFLDENGNVFFRHEGLLDLQAIKGVFKMKDITGPEPVTQTSARPLTEGADVK